jgi:hypothetical protein
MIIMFYGESRQQRGFLISFLARVVSAWIGHKGFHGGIFVTSVFFVADIFRPLTEHRNWAIL